FSPSNKGAAGIWQLMPDTASGYGVRQDVWYDGRRDVIASTHAALNYLAYLQSFFEGNWLFAIAAYNTGEGNVMAAIKRNIRDGRDTDFWSLPVAQQTKDFVPSLLALAIIISHPEQYPVYFPPVRNAPYLAQIDVGAQVNLKYAAELAGLDYKRMMQLNSGFNRHTTTTTQSSTKLVLPIENVEQFTENLAMSPFHEPTPPINWSHYANKTKKSRATIVASKAAVNYTLQPGDTIYMVRAHDTLISIAARFHVNVQALQIANQLESTMVRPGKELIIPTHLANAGDGKLQPGDTIYMVRRGDTIDKIADRFHTSASAIRLTNLVDDNSLVEGEKLVVPTHFSG
ncbi:MAG: LysM peptidoglycan-binding domain-containing protein, partial [Gammaproteobacteria bacterium]